MGLCHAEDCALLTHTEQELQLDVSEISEPELILITPTYMVTT